MQKIVEPIERLVENDYKGRTFQVFIGELQEGDDTA